MGVGGFIKSAKDSCQKKAGRNNEWHSQLFFRTNLSVAPTAKGHILSERIRYLRRQNGIMLRLLFFGIFLLSSCSSTALLTLRPETSLEHLGIRIEETVSAPPAVVNNFRAILDDFIVIHNANPDKAFLLFHATPDDPETLTIRVLDARYVSPPQQITSVVVNVVLLAVPLTLLYMDLPFIWYFVSPQAKTLTEISLSPDINGDTYNRLVFPFKSPGFLLPKERQIDRQNEFFHRQLTRLVDDLERQSVRQKAGTDSQN